MPDLRFSVEGIDPARSAVAPTLLFKLRVENAVPGEQIHSILLRCQIHIEAPRRPYTVREKDDLYELFDRPERWGKTLRSLLWTQTTAVIGCFESSGVAELPVPCTFDFNVAGAKYFHAIRNGDVPLTLLFSGTVFYVGTDGALHVAQIPWNCEAGCRLPVSLWHALIETYYPNGIWLCLRNDAFDRLQEFKVRNGLPSIEAALEKLLATYASTSRTDAEQRDNDAAGVL